MPKMMPPDFSPEKKESKQMKQRTNHVRLFDQTIKLTIQGTNRADA